MPSIYNSIAQTPTDLKIATQTRTFDCLNKLPICICMPLPYLFYTVNHQNLIVHHVHHITTTTLFLLSIRITTLFILYNAEQPPCLTLCTTITMFIVYIRPQTPCSSWDSHYNHTVYTVLHCVKGFLLIKSEVYHTVLEKDILATRQGSLTGLM